MDEITSCPLNRMPPTSSGDCVVFQEKNHTVVFMWTMSELLLLDACCFPSCTLTFLAEAMDWKFASLSFFPSRKNVPFYETAHLAGAMLTMLVATFPDFLLLSFSRTCSNKLLFCFGQLKQGNFSPLSQRQSTILGEPLDFYQALAANLQPQAAGN